VSEAARERTIPLPRPSELSKPHWEGCRNGELRVQRCSDCGAFEFVPKPVCTRCFSESLEWVTSSGRGHVYSYTEVHRPQRPSFDVPYIVAIIELEEGWHMLTNLVECTNDDVSVGLEVEVDFRRMSDTITLPYFRPSDSASGA
jgi:uncharacterized OB-fold protein